MITFSEVLPPYGETVLSCEMEMCRRIICGQYVMSPALSHSSPSRVADLVRNACPAVHSTDSLPYLHTGVSPYRVKETQTGLRKFAHFDVDIDV